MKILIRIIIGFCSFPLGGKQSGGLLSQIVCKLGWAFIFLLLSCNKENIWDCIQTTGEIVSETREVNSFTSIQLEDNMNLIITQDSVEGLSIEGGENLLPEIITEVIGDTLVIKNLNSCNWVRRFDIPINVYVSVKELKNICLYGYGTVDTPDTLTVDSLRVYGWDSASKINLILNANHAGFHLSTGPTNLKVTGNTNTCFIYSAGFAIGDLSELLSKDTHVNSSGTGDFYINVSQNLSVEIRNYGNIYYYGTPAIIDTTIVGDGKLIKIN